MKILKYNLIRRINAGTFETPQWELAKGAEVTMPYTDANLAIAQKEAWLGEVTVAEDGQPEPAEKKDLQTRVADLETESAETKQALEMILAGVTE